MRRVIITVATVAAIAGGATYWPIHTGKQLAAARLVDPDSAKFRGIERHGGVICGEINGKNRIGAYAGFERFAAFTYQGVERAWIWSDGPEAAKLIDVSCK